MNVLTSVTAVLALLDRDGRVAALPGQLDSLQADPPERGQLEGDGRWSDPGA